MSKLLFILFICLGLSFQAVAQEKHKVNTGDTLWDLAGKYYDNNFSWPIIWKYNTFINNPDLIYPNQTIVIPGFESGQIKLSSKNNDSFKLGSNNGLKSDNVKNSLVDDVVSSNNYDVEKKPVVKIRTTESGLQIIPYTVDFQHTNSYETLVKVVPNMKVIATEEGKHYVSTGDVLRINAGANKEIKVGQPIIIFHFTKELDAGSVLVVAGYGKVKKVDAETSLVMLDASYDSISKGFYAGKFDGFDRTNPKGFMNVNSDTVGKIVYFENDTVVSAEGYRCIIQLGSDKGVKKGDIFFVTREINDGNYKRTVKVGEVQAVYVNHLSTTAMIIQSDKELKIGDKVVLKKVAVY